MLTTGILKNLIKIFETQRNVLQCIAIVLIKIRMKSFQFIIANL